VETVDSVVIVEIHMTEYARQKIQIAQAHVTLYPSPDNRSSSVLHPFTRSPFTFYTVTISRQLAMRRHLCTCMCICICHLIFLGWLAARHSL